MKRRPIALFLLCAVLCGCSHSAGAPKDTPIVVTGEELTSLFNAAVEKLAAAESYRMIGNVTSTAEVISADGSGEVVTLHSPVLTTVENGSFLNSSDGGDMPHTTYFDGTQYYLTLPADGEDIHYRTDSNDYCDFPATAYLKTVNAEAVFQPSVIPAEGGGNMLTFDIPCALYDSEAVYGWLGSFLDEMHAAQELHISVSINPDGYPTSLYLFFSTVTPLGDDSIRQELAAGLNFYDFDSASLMPPSDLAVYEDWSESDPTADSAGFVEIPPEDLD